MDGAVGGKGHSSRPVLGLAEGRLDAYAPLSTACSAQTLGAGEPGVVGLHRIWSIWKENQ